MIFLRISHSIIIIYCRWFSYEYPISITMNLAEFWTHHRDQPGPARVLCLWQVPHTQITLLALDPAHLATACVVYLGSRHASHSVGILFLQKYGALLQREITFNKKAMLHFRLEYCICLAGMGMLLKTSSVFCRNWALLKGHCSIYLI